MTIEEFKRFWGFLEIKHISSQTLFDDVGQLLKQACDQQKVMCYRNYLTEYDDNGAGDLILRSPYPEGVK